MDGKKRAIPLILALALLLSCFPFNGLTAFAETTNKPTISVESRYAASDSTVDVNVDIVNNPGVAGAKISLNFSDKLTLLGATSGDTFAALDYTEPASYQNGCAFNWDSLDAEVTQDGTLLTLSFRVASNVAANEALNVDISYRAGDIYNKELDSLDFEVSNGTVTVINYLPGDANGDGAVNGKDVTTIRRYNAGHTVSINEAAADVNDDGVINGKDATLVRRYNAGYADVELKPSTPKCQHVLEAVSAKAQTCEEDGNIAYWHCTECDKYFSDAAATKEIALSNTVISSLGGHTPVVDPAVPATATSTGLTEGSHCSVCGKVLVAQQITPILQKEEYTITYNIAGNDTYLAQQNIQMPAANVASFTSSDTVIFGDISCPGYRFLGWYDAYGNAMPSIPAGTKRNITVYAKWQTDTYPVVFKYDNELAGLIDTSVLENVEYTVNKTKALPVLSLPGYTFIGWTDENGVLCDQIKPGASGEKIFYANWISDRSKAWKAKDLGTPYAYEDDNWILFTYEIGKIENVPIYEIENFGKIIAGGVSETRTKEVSAQMSKSLVDAYSSTVEKETTGNATWTLSDGWTDSMSISEEWAKEQGLTVEEVEERSKTETGNWYVNNSSGGSKTSTTIDSTDTYDLASTTNNKKTYGSTDTTEYGGTSTEKGWHNDATIELGAQETIKSSGVLEVLGAKGAVSLEQNLTLANGAEGKTTNKTGSDTVNKTGSDSDEGGGTQTGTLENHTENTVDTSNWSNESGFGGSTSNEQSTKVAQAVSELISSKTGYGQSYIKTGSSSETQGLSTTNANKDTFSSQVTYSTVTQEKETVTYSTGAAATGYHRWVMAATAHVFGVVGYDKEKESYFTTTYSIMDDNLQKYQDYSYKTGSYDDNQSGIIDFNIPNDIAEYVKARTFTTEGLEFDLDGYVTAYHGTDSAVIIPEYKAIDNGDNTKTLVKVVGIKENVFKGNTNITGVALSDFITEIPAGAFEGCTELWELYGAGLNKIGENAFAGCDKLRTFALSSNITELGNGATSSTDFLEVKASNASVVEAALTSGAKNIVIDLDKMTDTLDGKTLEIPEGTESFVLRGYGKSYENLTIISHAEETKLNRVNITSDSEIPLQLDSKEVVLCQVTVTAKGISALFGAADTNLWLYGTANLASEGAYSLFCKNTNIQKIDGDLFTELNVSGNVVTCGQITGMDYLNTNNGEVIEVSEEDFDKMLHSYNLLFDANGGSCTETAKEVPNGIPLGELPVPTRDYYIFDGWYTDAEAGELVDENTALTSATDITLYAHWTRQICNITFNGNAEDATVSEASLVVNCGEAVGTLPTPSRPYYQFDGWYTDNGEPVDENTVYQTPQDAILYAHWLIGDTSGWVKASEVPSGAQIVDRKWSYTQRSYTTSGNSSEPGWTKYDTKRTSWGATQGPVYSDPSNGARNVWSESYVASSNYKPVYVYYRWTSGPSDSGSTYSYDTGYVHYYRLDSQLEMRDSNWYGHQTFKYWYNGVNYKIVLYSGTEQQWVSDNYATRWYYQEPVYTYYHYKDDNLESDTEPSGSDISDVTEWVTYRSMWSLQAPEGVSIEMESQSLASAADSTVPEAPQEVNSEAPKEPSAQQESDPLDAATELTEPEKTQEPTSEAPSETTSAVDSTKSEKTEEPQEPTSEMSGEEVSVANSAEETDPQNPDVALSGNTETGS